MRDQSLVPPMRVSTDDTRCLYQEQKQVISHGVAHISEFGDDATRSFPLDRCLTFRLKTLVSLHIISHHV